MIKKFLIFGILLISQKLIICADECSVFSCSNLSPADTETKQTCTYIDDSCESKFTSCEGLSETDCKSDNEKIKLKSPTQECEWITADKTQDGVAKCQLKQLKCSDYIDRDEVPPVPVKCESLEASTGKDCITDTKTGKCYEESGCPEEDTTTCTTHKPLDSNHKWDHLKKCEVKEVDGENKCKATPKLCTEIETGDDCTKLSTSDNTKKKCFLESDGSCVEKFVQCEYHTGANTDNSCEAISNYIKDNDKYKCEFDEKDNTCNTIRKKCSDFADRISCNNYKPEDSTKSCFFTATISDTTEKCHELTKIPTKCADLKELADINDAAHCRAIKEDSYSECDWDTTKNECVRKPNECESDAHDSPLKCDHILINKTHECQYIENSCVEVKYYSNCNLYSGTERAVCEFIIPPESNKRCILLNDKQCVSVPKECEDYEDKEKSEYECINNYKPLDENYKCVFTGGSCTGVLKQKEYCYQGDESQTICEAIIPKNNGENYSIKCKFEDPKCVRVEKPCEDYTAGGPEICSSIIPKDQNKKCILRNTQCVEEYKTCKAYNDDKSVTTIVQTTCESIISNDGKKCKYTAGQNGGRATCASDIKNKCVDTLFNSEVALSSACASIKLSDISKKCSFSNGECLSKSKSCLELVFNGNEEGIENMCKSAEASANKKCIISSDKKRCLEVDKSLVIEDEPSGPGGNENTNDSTNGNGPNQPEGPNGTEGDKGTEGEKGTEGADESKPNSGKTIYLNSLIAMILFLLL